MSRVTYPLPNEENQMPKLHFTARAVDALKPGTKQIDYFDTTLSGFVLRVSATGIKTWNFIYRHQSRLRRMKIGRYPELSLVDARQVTTAAKGTLAKGIDPSQGRDTERTSGTFSELAAVYLEKYAKLRKRTWRQDERFLNKDFIPLWGTRKLTTLTTADIRSAVERIQRRGGRGVMANHAVSLLRTMFEFAVEQQFMEQNPCGRLRQPVPTRVRERVLSLQEVHAFWWVIEAKNKLTADVLRFQLLTGQRIGEVMSMAWEDIDLQSGWWTIPAHRAKNGRAHRVPISQLASEILEQRRLTSASQWVFPGPADRSKHVLLPTLQRYIMQLRKQLDFSTHDLRRTVATELSRSGVSRIVIKRILNHRDLDITARYDHHSYDTEAKSALEHWSRQVQAAISGEMLPTKVVAFGR